MSKYSSEFKLKVVKYYLEKGIGYKNVGYHFDVSCTSVLIWVRQYKLHAEKGLKSCEHNHGKKYSGNFRLEVLKYMYKNNLSYIETGIRYRIGTPTIEAWDKIYKKKGKKALYGSIYKNKKIKKSKQERKMNEKEKRKMIENLQQKDKKELIEIITDLRMENAVIKKLIALAQEKEKQQQKKK